MAFCKKSSSKESIEQSKKGTWETNAENVNYDLYLDYVLNKVIPSITEKWPQQSQRRHAIEHIAMQHDNAPVHFDSKDNFKCAAETDRRFKFFLREQPPNSPDTNILDLGFFVHYRVGSGNTMKRKL